MPANIPLAFVMQTLRTDTQGRSAAVWSCFWRDGSVYSQQTYSLELKTQFISSVLFAQLVSELNLFET